MLEGDKIKVAQGENPCYLLLDQANRHGLIAGASGTGKTVTMKVLAEGSPRPACLCSWLT